MKSIKKRSIRRWWLLSPLLLLGASALLILNFLSSPSSVLAQSDAASAAVAKTVTLPIGTSCPITASNYDSYLNECVVSSFTFASAPKHLDCVEVLLPASQGHDLAVTCALYGINFAVPATQSGAFYVVWEDGVVKLLQPVNGRTDTPVQITYSASTRS